MKTTELQSELHKIIDQVRDKEILQAVHTLLASQIPSFAFLAGGPLTKEDIDKMLQASEEDIKYGRVIKQRILKEEIKTWRKK